MFIEQGIVHYAEGTWVLPDEPTAALHGGMDIGSLVDAAFESRFARFTPALRTLSLCLSPNRRLFDITLCQALTQHEPDVNNGRPLSELLSELVREGILIEHQGAFAFAGSRTREILYDRLSDEQKRKLHGRLAEFLADEVGADPKRGFEIGFHFLLAGHDKRARSYLNRHVEASLQLERTRPSASTFSGDTRKR